MARADLILKSDLDFGAQMKTFKNNIAGYAVGLGLTPAQVTTQAADSDYFNYVLACQQMLLNSSKGWSTWKKIVRAGRASENAKALTAPVLPAAVPTVSPGVEQRFRALVRQVKASAFYNPSIGVSLGIEAVDRGAPDPVTLQPVLTLVVNGDHVEVGWDWQGYRVFLDQCELEVDRGDGKGFVQLTYDTTPGYNDLAPFPAAPIKWCYRAIYRVGDERIGRWSNIVGITVPP